MYVPSTEFPGPDTLRVPSTRAELNSEVTCTYVQYIICTTSRMHSNALPQILPQNAIDKSSAVHPASNLPLHLHIAI